MTGICCCSESADMSKHGGGFLTPSNSVRRVHCPECSLPMDSYTEETIVLCIVTAETYLNHDLQQAASMIYDMIESISRIASTLIYSWQSHEWVIYDWFVNSSLLLNMSNVDDLLCLWPTDSKYIIKYLVKHFTECWICSNKIQCFFFNY